jgi:hypothetical protein
MSTKTDGNGSTREGAIKNLVSNEQSRSVEPSGLPPPISQPSAAVGGLESGSNR